jgi:hypothetical protein
MATLPLVDDREQRGRMVIIKPISITDTMSAACTSTIVLRKI